MSLDHHRRRTLRIARREIGLIVGFGLVVLVVVGIGAGVVSRSAARLQALSESGRATRALANLVVAPLLPAYLDRQAGAAEALDRALAYGLAEGPLADVTIWQEDGYVVYSTQTPAGQRLTPPPEVVKAVQGTPTTGLEEHVAARTPPPTSRAEPPVTVSGRQRDSYVKVYVPLNLPDRPALAFEAYYDYQPVSDITRELLSRFLPLILVPLIVLQLIQLPAALSLASRLRRKEDERARLFSRALEISDRERGRFAADLHDGPIQDLAGVSYALGALAPAVPEQQAPMMERVQQAVQRSVQSLRSLMTDLYPPDLHSGTLAGAIDGLAQPLREAGIQVDLDLDELPGLERETAVTLYRACREVLANVQKHARATRVSITASTHAAAAPEVGDRVRLVVTDNGVGTDIRRIDRRNEGHLGLRLVIDRVHSSGGRFTLTSSPGKGTRVEADLPLHPADS
ncbi:MAG: sensor histidine kinase [Friedmanniella sp.]